MNSINKKNGFTMIELLSVVAILAILVIIVIPNVLKMFRSARKDTFSTEAKSLYNTVMKQNFLTSSEPHLYSTGSLDISGGGDLEYSISTNNAGQVTCFLVRDTNFMWIYGSDGRPLTNEDNVAKEDEIVERDDDIIIDCSGAQLFDVTVPATLGSNGTWWLGNTDKSKIERIIFTYSYTSNDYDETFYSDEERVGGLATYINNNIAYVVINRNKRKNSSIKMPSDSSNTFKGFTNLKNISGLKLLDFSNVTNMDNFFGNNTDGNSLSYINGYESFNTSKVTSAKYAFAGVKLSSFNLSNWNTSNMHDVTGMFYKTNATTINLAGWNVSNITNYNNMFADNSRLESVNLVGWNTKASANYTGMFDNCNNLISISAGDGFKVSNTDVSMFKNDTKLIGVHGTTFINDKSLYARVDKEGTPGYFSGNNNNAIVAAKLYNSGSVTGAYTDLTSSGSVPPDWDYYAGARLLEVKLFSMNKGAEKTLNITVPSGMYIVNNSWTKTGNGISSVNFTKLANQGTGSYSNNQTGTLKYTFGNDVTTSSIQLLVMFDTAIWDKNKKDAAAMGTDNMTLSPPIVVNFDNGKIIKKIANIHSAVSIGRSSNGLGYSFYSSNYNSNIYEGISTMLLASNYLLSSDQSSVPYFYKKITYETYATFKNTSNQDVNATIEEGFLPTGMGSSGVTLSNNNTKYSGTWNNVYTSSATSFPRPKYLIKKSDNPKIGSNLTVHIIATLTTLSGQTKKFDTTKTFKIRNTTLTLDDLTIGNGNKDVPNESYYDNSGYSDILGIFTLANKGYEQIDNAEVVFEYDTETAKNNPPSLKVRAARPFLQKNQKVNAEITLINDSGAETSPLNYEIESKNTGDGAYVLAEKVASSHHLTGNYYLKKIKYTIPVISGIKESSTYSINYLYHSSGSASQTSGGNFMGVATKQATSKCTITVGSVSKNAISTTKITSTPSFSGYISKIETPLGKDFTSGDDIELAINAASCSYPYTNTQAFSRPEIYLVLPFGINIDSVIIGNSMSATTTEVPPIVTKTKTLYIGDELNNVYKITPNKDLWFGYLKLSNTGPTGGQYTSKWFRIKLTTDISMEYTSFNLRDRVFFKDKNGHISVSGSYAKNCVTDQYDVDNDGSTVDKFGTIDNANQIISIHVSEEEGE